MKPNCDSSAHLLRKETRSFQGIRKTSRKASRSKIDGFYKLAANQYLPFNKWGICFGYSNTVILFLPINQRFDPKVLELLADQGRQHFRKNTITNGEVENCGMLRKTWQTIQNQGVMDEIEIFQQITKGQQKVFSRQVLVFVIFCEDHTPGTAQSSPDYLAQWIVGYVPIFQWFGMPPP